MHTHTRAHRKKDRECNCSNRNPKHIIDGAKETMPQQSKLKKSLKLNLMAKWKSNKIKSTTQIWKTLVRCCFVCAFDFNQRTKTRSSIIALLLLPPALIQLRPVYQMHIALHMHTRTHASNHLEYQSQFKHVIKNLTTPNITFPHKIFYFIKNENEESWKFLQRMQLHSALLPFRAMMHQHWTWKNRK